MNFFSPFLLKPNSPKIGKFWFQILVPITYVILLVLFYNLSYELFYSWVLSGEWNIVTFPLSMPKWSSWVKLEYHLVSLFLKLSMVMLNILVYELYILWVVIGRKEFWSSCFSFRLWKSYLCWGWDKFSFPQIPCVGYWFIIGIPHCSTFLLVYAWKF